MTWLKWAAAAVAAWLLYRHFASSSSGGTGVGSGAVPAGTSFNQSGVGNTGYSTSTTSRTPILAFPVVRGGPLPLYGAITVPSAGAAEARSGRGHF